MIQTVTEIEMIGVMATMRARGDAGEGNTVMEVDLMG